MYKSLKHKTCLDLNNIQEVFYQTDKDFIVSMYSL